VKNVTSLKSLLITRSRWGKRAGERMEELEEEEEEYRKCFA
jgi:hypothetical protein